MSAAVVQNISVPAGDTRALTITVSPNDQAAFLAATEVEFAVYEQQFSVPVFSIPALFQKTLSAGQITDNPSTLTVTVELEEADTINLLRNYYHETTMLGGGSPLTRTTVNQGVFTVTETENRP